MAVTYKRKTWEVALKSTDLVHVATMLFASILEIAGSNFSCVTGQHVLGTAFFVVFQSHQERCDTSLQYDTIPPLQTPALLSSVNIFQFNSTLTPQNKTE
jgi:hypothetical protein